MSTPAAVAAALSKILEELSGSIKTKQLVRNKFSLHILLNPSRSVETNLHSHALQAALQRLVPILKDQIEVLGQVLHGNSSSAANGEAKHGKIRTLPIAEQNFYSLAVVM